MTSTRGRPRIGVVDYGMGNRRSVQKALEHVGAIATITRDHDELRAADALVVPGVGAFPLAMANLHELGLATVIQSRASDGTPILGICLGMQLLFDRSHELGQTDGLGIISGEVTPLRAGGLRVPHIGWNEVSFARECVLTEGLPSAGCPFYHVHSLAPRPSDLADIVARTEYGERFATIVAHGVVFGVQFHPEKSSAHGLRMLANFVRVSSERPTAHVAGSGGTRVARLRA
jgi:imidazole glycerol-phosphate synthase subunit HisH